MTDDPADDPADDLADALAERALSRCAATMAVAAACLALLSLLFLQLADGRVDARSLPQLVVLGWGCVTALVVAAGCTTRARAVLRTPGTGPGHASGAVRLVGRAVVAVPVGGVVLTAGCVASLSPRTEALLSGLVALALASQVALLAVVRRASLRRAARVVRD